MSRIFKRISLPLLLCLLCAGTVATGCDFRKYYRGHKSDCHDDDCKGCRNDDCGDCNKYPRDWNGDNGDTGNKGDTTDRYRCLQNCYDEGYGKTACQQRCDNVGTPNKDGGTTSPDSGSKGDSGGSTDSGGSSPDTGAATDGGAAGDQSSGQPEIDQEAYDTCWRECKQKGEVDCVCESKCRSVARGVWVSKCWESCAKSQQDLAVCKQKCDA